MNPLHSAYSILGLEPGSSSEEVQARYKRLAKVWHPDRFPNDEERRDAEKELEKIVDATQLLLEHFDSKEHRQVDCECSPFANTQSAESDDEDNEADTLHRSPMKRRGLRNRQQAGLSMDERRDRRFNRRMRGELDDKTDEDHEIPQKGRMNEKVLNWIVIGIAAIFLVVGWLSTAAPTLGPNQAQQAAPTQMLQSPQSQGQPMNPLQQMLRSTGEQQQSQEPTQEQTQQDQAQQAQQEQAQQAQQEQAQQAQQEQAQQAQQEQAQQAQQEQAQQAQQEQAQQSSSE